VWRSHQLWVRGYRVRTEPARTGSVFFWGARCAAWLVVKPPPPQKKPPKNAANFFFQREDHCQEDSQ
jgi:hypothetical protein